MNRWLIIRSVAKLSPRDRPLSAVANDGGFSHPSKTGPNKMWWVWSRWRGKMGGGGIAYEATKQQILQHSGWHWLALRLIIPAVECNFYIFSGAISIWFVVYKSAPKRALSQISNSFFGGRFHYIKKEAVNLPRLFNLFHKFVWQRARWNGQKRGKTLSLGFLPVWEETLAAHNHPLASSCALCYLTERLLKPVGSKTETCRPPRKALSAVIYLLLIWKCRPLLIKPPL